MNGRSVEVVASVETPAEAAAMAELHRPDVVLLARPAGGLAADVVRAVLALADLGSRDGLS